MGLLMWITIGLIVSVLTLAIEPYVNRRHIPITIGLGLVGGIIGGAIGSFLGFGSIEGMHFMIIVMSIGWAVLLLTSYREFEQAELRK